MGGGYDLCELDDDDGIPEDVFVDRVPDPEVRRLLYDDLKVLRFTRRQKYDDETVLRRAHTTLHDLRVKYLLKEITEQQWTSRIMTACLARDKALATAAMLTVHIATLRALQRDMYNARLGKAGLLEQLSGLHVMLNANLADVQAEFGGQGIRVREDPKRLDDPILIM